MSAPSRRWFWAMTLGVSVALALRLAQVWVNIERTDLAYGIERLEHELAEKRELVAKLEVERDSLLSPGELGRLAKQFGLRPAQPGQIRRPAAP
ncbi:MAG: hypothetical protein AB7D57_00060 [Desulfovibrionaceae bacterium]